MKVSRVCKHCRDSFVARSADVARGWAKFCSKSCKAKEQESRTHQNAEYQAAKFDRDISHAMSDAEQGWDAHKDFI